MDITEARHAKYATDAWGASSSSFAGAYSDLVPLIGYEIVKVGEVAAVGDVRANWREWSPITSSFSINSGDCPVFRKIKTTKENITKEIPKMATEPNKPGFVGGALGKAWGSTKRMAPAVLGQEGIEAGIEFLADKLGEGNPAIKELIKSAPSRKLLGVLIPAFASEAAERYPGSKIMKSMAGPLAATLDAGAYEANKEIFEGLLMPMLTVMAMRMGVDVNDVQSLLEGFTTPAEEEVPVMPIDKREKVEV